MPLAKLKPLRVQEVGLEFYAPDMISRFLAKGHFTAGKRYVSWVERPTGEVDINEEEVIAKFAFDGYEVEDIVAFLAKVRPKIKQAWRDLPQEIKGRALSAYLEYYWR